MFIHNRELSRLERKVLGLVARVPPGARVLELAPGSGALAAAVAGLGHRVEALDIHPELFGQAGGVSCRYGNLDEPLPFGDNTFDLALCCEGIEHLEFQYGFARELARVLRPGGSLVLTTPNIVNTASRLRFLLTGFYALAVRPSSEFRRDRTIEHIYPLTFWQLRHILHTAGLLIEKVYTDHIRRSALMLAWLWPLSYLFTRHAMHRESEPRQLRANLEILGQLHSAALFFGRTQIILARKGASTYLDD
ncbi:MAG: class I SAM-dependent methyltransferase [Candidatus Glassbacteria bacterium]|nr:class I SAM-dependent methyltransferase [Candidatus Glassbacteria bacterium]